MASWRDSYSTNRSGGDDWRSSNWSGSGNGWSGDGWRDLEWNSWNSGGWNKNSDAAVAAPPATCGASAPPAAPPAVPPAAPPATCAEQPAPPPARQIGSRVPAAPNQPPPGPPGLALQPSPDDPNMAILGDFNMAIRPPPGYLGIQSPPGVPVAVPNHALGGSVVADDSTSPQSARDSSMATAVAASTSTLPVHYQSASTLPVPVQTSTLPVSQGLLDDTAVAAKAPPGKERNEPPPGKGATPLGYWCQCVGATRRLPMIPGESFFRCLECMSAHRDQDATNQSYQIIKPLQLALAESRAEADAVVVGRVVGDPAVDQPTALGDAAVAGSEQRGGKKDEEGVGKGAKPMAEWQRWPTTASEPALEPVSKKEVVMRVEFFARRPFLAGYRQHNAALKWYRGVCEREGVPEHYCKQDGDTIPVIDHPTGMDYAFSEDQKNAMVLVRYVKPARCGVLAVRGQRP